jgi:Tfp pilus assembly protein PilO
MSNWIESVSDWSPMRKLLVAVLLAVVLAQAAAMAMLARSQVHKAEAREMKEAVNSSVAAQKVDLATPQRAGTMTVGYAGAR